MHTSLITDYSIVICTYNPEERILRRCLAAVAQLVRKTFITETILVDNNSKQPVSELTCVQEFRNHIPAFKVIHVKQQGVQHARIEAIKQATGNYIVYIDYDNEPATDYLQQLGILNNNYPEVGAWGPGHVHVDFIDGVADDIAGFARGAFQERHDNQISFSRNEQWQYCYPFGTGLCTRAEILRNYVTQAEKGLFTLPGRKGNKLTSGEDTQMVLLCLQMGYAAGVAPGLKLNHIIPASRANKRYLERLIYGTYISYHTSLLQVFPGQRGSIVHDLMSPSTFARLALKKYLRMLFSKNQNRKFKLIEFIASNAGMYEALNKPLPVLVQQVIRQLQVV